MKSCMLPPSPLYHTDEQFMLYPPHLYNYIDAVERIDAHTVHGYVIHDLHTKSSVTLSYPLDKNNAIMTGRSFHHGRFVMGLRNQARKYGYVL